MNKRDDLLFYARNLSDERIHRMVGKCMAEGGRQVTSPEPEPSTPSIRTELAAILPDLPDSTVSDLLKLAQGMVDASPDSLAAITLFLSLHPDYAHMVRVAAQALHDIQTAQEAKTV